LEEDLVSTARPADTQELGFSFEAIRKNLLSELGQQAPKDWPEAQERLLKGTSKRTAYQPRVDDAVRAIAAALGGKAPVDQPGEWRDLVESVWRGGEMPDAARRAVPLTGLSDMIWRVFPLLSRANCAKLAERLVAAQTGGAP
jgi:hypothetical protein